MNELLEKGQEISIVPQDYKHSNKGKVLDIKSSFFTLEAMHEPEGILPKKVVEFYSQTKHGMLYFSSGVIKVDGNLIVATFPRKHRFLPRRAFTRIKFIQDLDLKIKDKTFKTTALDLSAGGLKLKTNEHLDIDSEYEICINLLGKNNISCIFEPIKMDKNEDGSYTLAGRFKNLKRTDRMKIIQFCIRKNIENKNR